MANFAFIDAQNLYLGIRDQEWKLDYQRFRIYLSEKYGVERAYLFLGFIKQNETLYRHLRLCGFVLVFKPTIRGENFQVKGNIDADLVLQAMIDIDAYDQAVVVTSDGDFYCLIKYLHQKSKLKVVLSPNSQKCSNLLKKSAREKIYFLNNLREKLEYKRKSTA